MLHRVGSVEFPVSVSSKYRAQRASESAARAVRLGLFASNTGNAEPSPPLACHRTVVSAGVRELAAPMPMSLTMDYWESSSAATSGLRFKISHKNVLFPASVENKRSYVYFKYKLTFFFDIFAEKKIGFIESNIKQKYLSLLLACKYS